MAGNGCITDIMNPVTSFLVAVSLGIGIVLTWWVNPLPGLLFVALAATAVIRAGSASRAA